MIIHRTGRRWTDTYLLCELGLPVFKDQKKVKVGRIRSQLRLDEKARTFVGSEELMTWTERMKEMKEVNKNSKTRETSFAKRPKTSGQCDFKRRDNEKGHIQNYWPP